MGSGTQAYGHLLNYDRHAKREGNEWNRESDGELGASGSVGEDAGAVVLSQHDEHPWPDQQPQEARSGGKAALCPSGGDSDAIMRTVDVFVSNENFFFGLEGDGLHRLRVGDFLQRRLA